MVFKTLHRSANNGFVFAVGKRKIITGVMFDVESESEIRISLLHQDFEIFEVMCSKNGVFRYFWGYVQGTRNFFGFFSQMSLFSTTLSLQNELLNSQERFFFHKNTAISSFDIYPNNLIWAFTLTLWCIPFCIRKFILKISVCGFWWSVNKNLQSENWHFHF